MITMDAASETFSDQAQMKKHRPLTLIYQVKVLSQNAQAIIKGVAAYVRPHPDWQIRIATESIERVIPLMKARRVDGAFVHPTTDAEADMVARCGIPCILTTAKTPQKVLPYFTANNRLIGRIGADHFIEKGFVNFAYYSPVHDLFWSKERLEGFTERVKQAGYAVHVFEPPTAGSGAGTVRTQVLSEWAPSSWMANTEYLRHWLRSLPKPIGVLAADDSVGYDLMEVINDAGIRIPEELAVLGVYNDLTRCLLARPPLSSIVLDLEQNGYNAAALLHRIILGKETMKGQRLVNEPTHIITRQSTDILAVNDPDLAAALHFIRNNFNRPIRVADVVKQTSTSRRGLEIKFRDCIKHSIAEEIMRVKVNQATNMLLESDMSMERIAECLAFCSPGHMRKVFKKFKGTTPAAFRSNHRKT
jgi:LacI family transcriptional regulator